MHEETLILTVLFFGGLLVLTTLLQGFAKKTSFPYSIAILLAGLAAQMGLMLSGSHFEFSLGPDFIYFVLLPLLLFESASKINVHQFQLQFRTITFLATFGLLVSIGTVGVLLAWLLQLPLGVALLFGAIISATDPIAVLSIFKSLGAPQRLAMLAEGESMFNDATAVIIFRVLGSIVIAEHAFGAETLFSSLATFSYVFIGSLIMGGLAGWGTSVIIDRVDNDRIIETTLTVALALLSFGIAEHFLHLSGVIATVAAGIALASFGQTRISGSVSMFMHELWEYIGFLAVSAVFFFAAFSLDTAAFWQQPQELLIVVGVVLLARSISTYASFWISNTLSFFKHEPNVPLSWQNVLNWGGLRGVIPLVLVYSLPETFIFRELMVGYTLVVFIYSVLVHGLSVKWLLKWQKLDRPKTESMIAHQEMRLLDIEESLEQLDDLPKNEFDAKEVQKLRMELVASAEHHQKQLLKLADPALFEKSLALQAIAIERETLQALFSLNHISEATVMEFTGELDLQQDAIQYPEVAKGRGYSTGGKLKTENRFHQEMKQWKIWKQRLPWLKSVWQRQKSLVVQRRIQMLRARLISSDEVIRYLRYISHFFAQKPTLMKSIDQLIKQHQKYSHDNQRELKELAEKYSRYYQAYQNDSLRQLVLR